MPIALINASYDGNPGGASNILRTIDITGAGFDPAWTKMCRINISADDGGPTVFMDGTLWDPGDTATLAYNLNQASGIVEIVYITDGIRVSYRLELSAGGTITDMNLWAWALVGKT